MVKRFGPLGASNAIKKGQPYSTHFFSMYRAPKEAPRPKWKGHWYFSLKCVIWRSSKAIFEGIWGHGLGFCQTLITRTDLPQFAVQCSVPCNPKTFKGFKLLEYLAVSTASPFTRTITSRWLQKFKVTCNLKLPKVVWTPHFLVPKLCFWGNEDKNNRIAWRHVQKHSTYIVAHTAKWHTSTFWSNFRFWGFQSFR